MYSTNLLKIAQEFASDNTKKQFLGLTGNTVSTTSTTATTNSSANSNSNPSSTSSASSKPALTATAANPSKFATQYKELPIKFTHPALNRALTQAQRRRSARLNLLMDKRNINSSSTTTDENSLSEIAPNPQRHAVFDDRRAKLEKFKKEKELRAKAEATHSAPAFKSGIAKAPTTKILPPVAYAHFNLGHGNSGPRPATATRGVTKTKSATAVAPTPTQGIGSRAIVTRSMTARNGTPGPGPSSAGSSASCSARGRPGTAPVAVEPKKKVTSPVGPGPKVVAPKQGAAGSNAKPQQKLKSPAPIPVVQQQRTFSSTQVQTEFMETDSTGVQTDEIAEAPAPVPPSVVAEPEKKKKKPKGMNFDDVFLKYNNAFVNTCKNLQIQFNKWTQALETPGRIPEEFHGEVSSVTGSTLLLIQSKMPQFGELLGFYLLKNQDPIPTLPDDLAGWWDVAIIQVDQVLRKYESLETLEINNWKLPVAAPVQKKKKDLKLKRERGALNENSANNNAENIPPRPVVAKAPAPSSGLKAMIAAKRAAAAAALGGEGQALGEAGLV